ncbi:MAG: chemotaxis protein CheA [Lachnospiraceae bacterium]|nr:chemotaxis protein CheA [Lachnospiraceae bacterium]
MDVSQYLEIFVDETKEHLQSLNEQILILEKEPDSKEPIQEIFRAAHSLKGMAGTMGYKRMQRLTHDLENVFSEIREGRMGVTDELVDVLFRGLDALEGYLDNIINTQDEGDNDNEDIIQDLDRILKAGTGAGGAAAPAPAKEEAAQTATATAAAPASADDKAKYHNLVLAEHEANAAQKAIEEKKKVFGLTVYIQETCLLKAARAFLVFKALEPLGDVIKAEPNVQDIEDERFDFDFSLILVTEADMDKVKEAVMSVSEIADCLIGAVDPASHVEGGEKKEESAAAKPAEKKEAPKAAAAGGAAKAPAKTTGKAVVNRSVRVDIEKLDGLMNLVSELIIAKNGLVSMSGGDNENKDMQGFNEQIEYLETVTTNLHETVMKVRMVPIESVVNKFPRMIRDLSKKLDKKMELYMTGEDTELDRTVVDEIGDPLMHLLRNSADHGLESNEERVKLGKPEVGSIFLDAYQEGNNVVIEVRDDGAGINIEKVKKKAVERGMFTEEQAEALSDKEAIDLLFLPSFSTADKISDVSGRGVGLDVVKTNIESLGGSIEAKTKKGEGSSFIVRLPLTLAIVQALMVELGQEKYAIPLGSIQTIENISKDEIKYVQNKEVIHLRGNVIPLIRLDELLDVDRGDAAEENLTVVIVSKGESLAGLVVDNLIGQQEIVIKSIGKFISYSKVISGATILGDGGVALIIDPNVLL